MTDEKTNARAVINGENILIEQSENDKEFVVFNEGVIGFAIQTGGKTFELIRGNEYPLSWFETQPPALLENLLAENFFHPRKQEIIARAKIIKKN